MKSRLGVFEYGVSERELVSSTPLSVVLWTLKVSYFYPLSLYLFSKGSHKRRKTYSHLGSSTHCEGKPLFTLFIKHEWTMTFNFLYLHFSCVRKIYTVNVEHCILRRLDKVTWFETFGVSCNAIQATKCWKRWGLFKFSSEVLLLMTL